MGNVANALMLAGGLGEAQSRYAYAVDLAERYGLQRYAAMLKSDAGLAALHAGKLQVALQSFRDSVGSQSIGSGSSGFAWAVGLRLRGLIDAPEIDAIEIETTVQTAIELRESQLVAAVSGAAARSLVENGEADRARTILNAAFPYVTVPDQAYWLCDVAAELLDEAGCAQTRALLAQIAQDQANPLAQAFLLLFDARRDGDRARALVAADAFKNLGWAVEEALAAEFAGERERAAAIYERIGATRALRRLRTGSTLPSDRSNALTRREREIAALAARGYSSKLIAAEIAIGERTVETHLAAAYRKLGVRSRVELAALFNKAQ